jgi:hypothetical protein
MPIKGNKPGGSQRIKEPIGPGVSTDDSHPLFSFQYIDRIEFQCCGDEHKAALSNKVVLLSQLTWRELRQSTRHGHGFESIPIEQIRGRFPSIITEDVAQLHVFRYHGRHPMIGLKMDKVFYVIFLDYNFSHYDHE